MAARQESETGWDARRDAVEQRSLLQVNEQRRPAATPQAAPFHSPVSGAWGSALAQE